MRRATLLVADRNPKFLEKTAEILDAAGHDMIPALDGNTARRILVERTAGGRPGQGGQEGTLDGVLAHAALPGLSGFAFCRQVKEADPALPVVLMFSAEDPRGELEAQRAGADNWLVRPLKKLELLYVARDLLQLRATLLRAKKATEARAQAEVSGGEPRILQFELFKRLLGIELKRSQRYGFPLSVLVASLDAPRGTTPPPPSAGPDLLATATRAAIRDIDIPVAFAERDVLVVMPHTDEEGAKVVAERIRKRVRTASTAPGARTLTASVGVVSVEGGARVTFPTLLAQATRAQKQAAEAGGDRVVMAAGART